MQSLSAGIAFSSCRRGFWNFDDSPLHPVCFLAFIEQIISILLSSTDFEKFYTPTILESLAYGKKFSVVKRWVGKKIVEPKTVIVWIFVLDDTPTNQFLRPSNCSPSTKSHSATKPICPNERHIWDHQMSLVRSRGLTKPFTATQFPISWISIEQPREVRLGSGVSSQLHLPSPLLNHQKCHLVAAKRSKDGFVSTNDAPRPEKSLQTADRWFSFFKHLPLDDDFHQRIKCSRFQSTFRSNQSCGLAIACTSRQKGSTVLGEKSAGHYTALRHFCELPSNFVRECKNRRRHLSQQISRALQQEDILSIRLRLLSN